MKKFKYLIYLMMLAMIVSGCGTDDLAEDTTAEESTPTVEPIEITDSTDYGETNVAGESTQPDANSTTGNGNGNVDINSVNPYKPWDYSKGADNTQTELTDEQLRQLKKQSQRQEEVSWFTTQTTSNTTTMETFNKAVQAYQSSMTALNNKNQAEQPVTPQPDNNSSLTENYPVITVPEIQPETNTGGTLPQTTPPVVEEDNSKPTDNKGNVGSNGNAVDKDAMNNTGKDKDKDKNTGKDKDKNTGKDTSVEEEYYTKNPNGDLEEIEGPSSINDGMNKLPDLTNEGASQELANEMDELSPKVYINGAVQDINKILMDASNQSKNRLLIKSLNYKKYSYKDNSVMYEIQINYNTTRDQYLEMKKFARKYVEEIKAKHKEPKELLSQINKKITDFGEYDDKQVNIYSPFSLYSNGYGVCQAYTALGRFFLDELGYPNGIAVGTVDGVAHTWNIVEIGGEKLHVDFTLNDTNKKDLNKYLLKTEDFMKQTHVIEDIYMK